MNRWQWQVAWLIAAAFGVIGTPALAAFSVVRNIPPEPNIGNNQSIASDTQLNLVAGGSIGSNFQAGASNGTSTNIEVNIGGGSVGNQFRAHGGSTVNINDGRVGDFYDANAGSVTNIHGGSIGFGFDAVNGSTVNLAGGTVGVLFDAGVGSQLHIYGDEFHSNGVPIPGTQTVGGAVVFAVPINSSFNGTLADGTPFAFWTGPFLSDNLTNTTLTLHTVNLPSVGPAMAIINSASPLQGLRGGQTLVVDNGGTLGDDFSIGRGSTLTALPGGSVGRQVEVVDATLNVAGGTVGPITAFDGSVINISSGVTGAVRGYDGSTINLTGGRISGQDGSSWFSNATLNFAGGEHPIDFSIEDTVLNVSGGKPAFGAQSVHLHAFGDSVLNVIATHLLLEGAPIAGLVPGVPFTITERDVLLTGTFRDGNAFQFELNESDFGGQDYLAPEVVVTVLLVPEPGAAMIAFSAVACSLGCGGELSRKRRVARR